MAPYAYSCFLALVSGHDSRSLEDQDLGGSLLYSGELDEEGCALVIGGNVAGCASLCVAADPAVQKKAIRYGIVDFLVTSLDEALRILKNEIRKRATVSVCVGKPVAEVEQEMLERGVQPEITRVDVELRLAQETTRSRIVRVFWMLDSAPLALLPKIDAIAQECLDASDAWNRRWLRLSPRFLRGVAPNTRVIDTDQEFADRFMQRTRSAYLAGEIQTMPHIQVLGLVPSEVSQVPKGGITPQSR